MDTERCYAVERYRYLPYGSPLCFPAADINLDTRVNIDDALAFENAFWAGDRRADINNNGRFDPEPPPPGPNEPQVPVWPGSDEQIFVREYVRTFLAYQLSDEGEFIGDGELAALHREALSPPAQPERQLRAIGRLSQTDESYGTPGYTNRFGYRGYWFEPELGLYFVRNRVLDPRFGKWLTRDPIGYAGGWNLYRYVEGRPGRFWDPMGLEPDYLKQIYNDENLGKRSILSTRTHGTDAGREATAFTTAFVRGVESGVTDLARLSVLVTTVVFEPADWGDMAITIFTSGPEWAMLGAMLPGLSHGITSEAAETLVTKLDNGPTPKVHTTSGPGIDGPGPELGPIITTDPGSPLDAVVLPHRVAKGHGAGDAHHVVQDAAVRELPGYKRSDGPTVTMRGPASDPGSPHGATRPVQRAARGGDLEAEYAIAQAALLAGGRTQLAVVHIMHQTRRHFEKILNLPPNTPTRCPPAR